MSYERDIKSQIELFYNINLDDGTVVNTRNSEDFFCNIISLDKFMKDKRIKIVRGKIQPSDYMDFENTFKDSTLNAVLEILNKQYIKFNCSDN
ncbi:hypothetical protein F3K33_22365 [Clostridium diolis]|uniref:Uncharacterized protein n=1 Tax=Clostridium diolis TaxID=223919 RepID=A0AAV3VSB3_9CLOT|nr:hypothetical protein [Clostridium diolis]QES75397.1 hypothetical protein F3K33_22365 [Clostridium diolis]GEA29383.1 hypothetical protein CDIOL_03060 [Clostridium diolis]